MTNKKIFFLSLLTLFVKNASPFVVTWTVAEHLSTNEFNSIFTILAAVGFVSAVGSLNLLFTAQSLYGHGADRNILHETFQSVFYIRFIVFAIIGYTYSAVIDLSDSTYLFFITLLIRMIYDYTYALLKITGKFLQQTGFVSFNLLIVSLMPRVLEEGADNTVNVFIVLIISELMPVICTLFIYMKTFRWSLLSPRKFSTVTMLLPGVKLLGLTLFLPLINNTFYVNMVNHEHYRLAESFNFSMKLGLAYATIFSVFSNFLIQSTDWKLMSTYDQKKNLRNYLAVGLILITVGCLLFSRMPWNQILFARERFENLEQWTFLTVLICCLIIATSLLNQIRIQLEQITKHEWAYWFVFSTFCFLVCVFTFHILESLFIALSTVVGLQIIVVVTLLLNIRKCFHT